MIRCDYCDRPAWFLNSCGPPSSRRLHCEGHRWAERGRNAPRPENDRFRADYTDIDAFTHEIRRANEKAAGFRYYGRGIWRRVGTPGPVPGPDARERGGT